MPNNPSSARNMLNMVRGPLSEPVASRPMANAAPVMDATEARVQRAYQNMGATMPVGTVENPVRMSAGGIIGNIGILNAASLRPTSRLTPEQQAYLDQFKAYEERYNTEYLPAFQEFEPVYNEWFTGYKKAAEDIDRGAFDLRLDRTKSGENTQLQRLQAQGWQVVGQGSNHTTIRPSSIQQVYTAPEPRMTIEAPESPVFPSGISAQFTPEQQAYLEASKAFQQQYTNEYLPAYQAYAPAMSEWEKQYADAQQKLNQGAYNLRLSKDKTPASELRRLTQEGYVITGSSKHWNAAPKDVSVVFKTPAPTLAVQRPTEPDLLPGFNSAEELQKALAGQVQQEIMGAQKGAASRNKALQVFADPRAHNLAGFAGSSTFGSPAPTEFFAKGGDVKSTQDFIRSKKALKEGGKVSSFIKSMK
jgi:hypothetical protein